MKLHIFNPEHDIALALDKPRFTPSHNVVKMRRELAFIPALWAEDGDFVLVEDIDYAEKASEKLSQYTKNVNFIDQKGLQRMPDEFRRDLLVDAWGWDRCLYNKLFHLGIRAKQMFRLNVISDIRKLSHRRTSQILLRNLGTPFKSHETNTLDEIKSFLEKYGNIVLKAPWSCSGRGVRFVNENSSPSIMRWAENIIRQQGSIMVEPYYDKLRDFAIEFIADTQGLRYCGLSLFQTYFASYSASLIATEEEKMEIICRYTTREYLNNIINVCQSFLSEILPNQYRGGIGIDMMVVKDAANDRFLIHPCVEINLRRTMGHTALSFPTSPTTPKKLMVIDFDKNFELKIKSI